MTPAGRPVAPKSAPRNRLAAISPARKAAFTVLLAVERGPSHSDDLLRGKAVAALSPADRNLATALVLGVLRWQLRLDSEMQTLLKRPGAALDPEVRIALRLGAFQIAHMDRIPARAAIDESVELAKQAGHRFASGMVNAVLRKLSASDKSVEAHSSDPVDGVACEGAHPAWMVERWASFYGLEAARKICIHGQTEPARTLHLVNSSVEGELQTGGVVLEPGLLLSAARTVIGGDVSNTAGFQHGRVRFQDEGSQLVAEIVAANLGDPEGKILDACAAPGGKTLILAERNPQARIVAMDSSPPRLEQLRQRLAGHAGRVECRLGDAAAPSEEAVFDLVLADVPCSGTGTLGRNPEIRHRLRPEDLSRQAERQRAILAAALRAVRPGGRVVYSTCSLEPEENEQVVAAVLAATPAARAVSLAGPIETLAAASILTVRGANSLEAALTSQGALRLLPGASPTDGFFIALIEHFA